MMGVIDELCVITTVLIEKMTIKTLYYQFKPSEKREKTVDDL